MKTLSDRLLSFALAVALALLLVLLAAAGTSRANNPLREGTEKVIQTL